MTPRAAADESGALAVNVSPPDPGTTAFRDDLRLALLRHFEEIGPDTEPQECAQRADREIKDAIRCRHAYQRAEYRAHELAFVTRYGRELLADFASGEEITPSAVCPVLCAVGSETRDSRLFRLATLLWSVPVSRGYGRRLRFLVRDARNGKLMGLFALTDPVFNLRARDTWVSWNVNDRRQRLVSVMDAHVVGAVPPYQQILGGKVIASLMTSQEVVSAFNEKYGGSQGLISGERKGAQLVLLTVSSSLGRSSLYNRLRLPGTVTFDRIGVTEGWGHFHIPDALFSRMREMLSADGHAYASGHQYGQGPNWRLRVIRVALKQLGLDEDLLRHGIAREVFAAPLVPEWRDYLCGQVSSVHVQRPSAAAIGRQAVDRWLIGRASRHPEYRTWTREHTWSRLAEASLASHIRR
jgi:hypothetical protein